MTKYRFGFALAMVASVFLAAGCVTTKKFEQAQSEMTTRVDGVQGKVEQQSARIDKLEGRTVELDGKIGTVGTQVGEVRQAAGDAMTRAQSAEKAARGKVLWQVTLNNKDVRFAADKFDLEDSGRAALDSLVDRVKGLDKMVFVEIQGHTDDRGSDQYNDVLGMKRAEVVRDYLHEKGLPLNLISTISYGSKKPVADNKTKAGRAENRRVEVLVLE